MDDVNLADFLVFSFSLPQCSDIFQALKRNQSLRFLDLRTSAVRVGHGMPWDDSDIHHVSHGRSDQPFSEETTRELKDAWNESRPLDHLLL